MTERLDCVVVGAGIVGLAIARALELAGRDVIVLESEPHIGMHTSSRNSEVIHAGLYYPEDSLKAQLCVRGKELLYAYCMEHHVNHERLGKLIVAPVEGGLELLREIKTQAEQNGVNDLRFLTADQVREFEPDVLSGAGLLSPSTGIIDSHELMQSLQAEIEARGGSVVCNSKVIDLQYDKQGISFRSGGERFVCKTLVNSAGLRAQDLVSRIKPFPQQKIPKIYFAKAHYFSYQGKSPFKHLVYPLPDGGGLGIHATNDLSGAARFGPDITWIDGIDYSFDESRKSAFVVAIKTYFPDLDEDRLTPAYTGIRPKLAGSGAQFTDFSIQFERDHGVPGLVNLFGIESPGLTACLAIGEYIRHNL